MPMLLPPDFRMKHPPVKIYGGHGGESGFTTYDVAIGRTVDLSRTFLVADHLITTAWDAHTWHFITASLLNSTTVRFQGHTDSNQQPHNVWLIELEKRAVKHVEIVGPVPNFNQSWSQYTASVVGADSNGVDPEKTIIIPIWNYTCTTSDESRSFTAKDAGFLNPTTFKITTGGHRNHFTNHVIHYSLIEGY